MNQWIRTQGSPAKACRTPQWAMGMLLALLVLACLLPLQGQATAQSLTLSVQNSDASPANLTDDRTLASFENGKVSIAYQEATGPSTLTVTLPYFYDFASTVTTGPHNGYTIDSISPDRRTMTLTLPANGGQAVAFSFNITLDRQSITPDQQDDWRAGEWNPNNESKLFTVKDEGSKSDSKSFPNIITTSYSGLSAGWYMSKPGETGPSVYSTDSYESSQLVSEHGDRVMFGGNEGTAELAIHYPGIDLYEVGPVKLNSFTVTLPADFMFDTRNGNDDAIRKIADPAPTAWHNLSGSMSLAINDNTATITPNDDGKNPIGRRLLGMLQILPVESKLDNSQDPATLFDANSTHSVTVTADASFTTVEDQTPALKVIDYTLSDNLAILNPAVNHATLNKPILHEAKPDSTNNVTGTPPGTNYPGNVTMARLGRQEVGETGSYTAPTGDGNGTSINIKFDERILVKSINLLNSLATTRDTLYHEDIKLASASYTLSNGTTTTLSSFGDQEFYLLKPALDEGVFITGITLNYSKFAYATMTEDIDRIIFKDMTYNIGPDAQAEDTYPITSTISYKGASQEAISYIYIRGKKDPTFIALGGHGNWTNNGQPYANNKNNGPFDDIVLTDNYVGLVKYADGSQVYLDDGTAYDSGVLDTLEKPRFEFQMTYSAAGYYTNGKIKMSAAMATGSWTISVSTQTAARLAAGNTAWLSHTFTVDKRDGAYLLDLYEMGIPEGEVIQAITFKSEDTIDLSSLSLPYNPDYKPYSNTTPLVELEYDSLAQNPLTGLYTGGPYTFDGDQGYQWTLNNGAIIQYANCVCVDGKHLLDANPKPAALRPGNILVKGAELLIPTAINTKWTGELRQGEINTLTADITLEAQAYSDDARLFSQGGEVFYLKLSDQEYVSFVPGTAKVDGISDPEADIVTLNGARYLKITNKQTAPSEKTPTGANGKSTIFSPWQISFDVFTLGSTPASFTVHLVEDKGNWVDLGETNPYTYGNGQFVSIQSKSLDDQWYAYWTFITENPNIKDDPLDLYQGTPLLDHNWALPFTGFTQVPNLSDRHGVVLHPGINGVFQPAYQAVRPHEQGSLTTEVGINAPTSEDIQGLSSTIKLPRKGEALAGDATLTSEVSLFLRGPLTMLHKPLQAGTTQPQVTYSSDGTTFIEESGVSDWGSISHVSLNVATIMAGDAMGMMMPLRTEAWGDPDGATHSGDLGKAYMQARFTAESGFLTESFDRANTYEFLPDALQGTVWLDANRDGWMDDGEAMMPGVTMNLYEHNTRNGKRLVDTTTTGADGSYRFETAAFQQLQVEAMLPGGYIAVQVIHPAPGNVFVNSADFLSALTTPTVFVDPNTLAEVKDINAGLVALTPVGNTTAQLTGSKILEGGQLKDGQFTFTLSAVAGNPEGATIHTPTAANQGASLSFGADAITFNQPGSYSFLISETAGTASNILYDMDAVRLTFTVGIEADNYRLVINNLSYEKAGEPATSIAFINQQYKPLDVLFAAKKVLSGEGAVLENGQFSFTLSGHGHERTATNDALGNVAFSPAIRFEEPGEYRFRIEETEGSQADVVYDSSVYEVILTITKAQNSLNYASAISILKNGEAINSQDIIFTNELIPAASPSTSPTTAPTPTAAPTPKPTPAPIYDPISVNLPVRKELKGKALSADAFTFILKDRAGNIIQRSSNQADGSVPFDARRFSNTGTYLYTIQEEKGNISTISYDSTIYTVKVTIKDQGGVLQSQVDYLKNGTPYAGQLVFVNQAQMPSTGDNLPTILTLLSLGAMLALGGAWLIRKREQQR